jgi:hypothetical protein
MKMLIFALLAKARNVIESIKDSNLVEVNDQLPEEWF